MMWQTRTGMPKDAEMAASLVHPLLGGLGGAMALEDCGASSIHLFSSKIRYVAWMAAPPGPKAVTGKMGSGMPLWSYCRQDREGL